MKKIIVIFFMFLLSGCYSRGAYFTKTFENEQDSTTFKHRGVDPVIIEQGYFSKDGKVEYFSKMIITPTDK